MSKKKTTDIANAKWVRLTKHIGQHWPYFSHPDHPGCDLHISGAFRVRWPDGTVSIQEVLEKDVRIMQKDGTLGTPETFLYFERVYNGMDLIHELHEVELLEEEVARCVIDPSRAAAAV